MYILYGHKYFQSPFKKKVFFKSFEMIEFFY